MLNEIGEFVWDLPTAVQTLLSNTVRFLKASMASDEVVIPLFLAIIATLFLVSLGFALFGKGSRFVAGTPNLLVSVGILGTFVGIVIGLQAFEITEIDDSIQFLLEGLKIAFITSIAGMLGSIVFRGLLCIPLFAPRERGAGKDIGAVLLDALNTQSKQLEALHKAIAGDEESSLAGQIKLFKGDMRDRHDAFVKELWDRLTVFAKMMSKSATEQVINALKDVIADFNAKLTEQFGENFKALDAAVHRLVEWQENYRVQLEQMGEQYKQGVDAITQTEASVARISEGAEKIPQAMKSLEEVLETNQHQIKELSRHLQAFADARDKAVEAVPELQKQVEVAVTNISNATQQLVAGISESTDQAKTAIITGAEELDNNVQRLSANLTNTSDALAVQTDKIREQLGNVVGDINSAAREMMTNLKDAGEQVQNDTKVIQKEFANSMANTAKEMDNNAQLLSTNLTNTSDALAVQTDKIREQLGKVVGDINSAAREMITNLKESSEQVQNDTKNIQKEFASSISTTQNNLENGVREVFENQTRELNQMFSRLEQTIIQTTENAGKSVDSQFKHIEKIRNQEIERVMEAMGKSLATITDTFTADYQKLVREMQRIVNDRGDRK